VTLTSDGDAAFHRLRRAAVAFDRRLRAGVADDEVAELSRLLGRLSANVAEAPGP
jgi:MarR family transcriptional regulator for hemolysin